MNTKIRKKLDAAFFCTECGSEPVREWLRTLAKPDKRTIGEDILTVQYGWPIGMPLVNSIGNGLWEVRTTLSGKRTARIIFFMDANTMILVHGFIKKTQQTPKAELHLAYKRKRQYEKAQHNEQT